jgi:DNA-binding NarL/FixJ family response regulator
MVKVLVADAQCIVRMGMKQLCRDIGGFTVTGEAANGEDALSTLDAAAFDMMVIEPNMPRIRNARNSDGGADLIDEIRVRHAELPILVFTGNGDLHAAKRVMHRGIRGFLTKDSNREIIATAMRKIAAGESYISQDVAVGLMLENKATREGVLQKRLSARELQVMKLLCSGMGVNAIAGKLFISSRTVSTHKARLMQKMNFKSNTEMYHYAVACGLVEPKPREDRYGLVATSGIRGTIMPVFDARESQGEEGRALPCSECTTCEHYRRADPYKESIIS